MPNFMLLLHEQPFDFNQVSAEEMQSIVAEYSAWRERLVANNQLMGGEKLKDEGGKILQRHDGQLKVTDGPYSEAKEILGGYFTIKAADYAEAVSISESCPHLTFGGRVELREIDEIHS